MPDVDAIVIGSGISGLSAALGLSRRGRTVVLCEAAGELGGMIRPVERGAYRFDTGVHYVGKLGPGETFRETLDQLGLDDVEFVELDRNGFDRYVFPDLELRFCAGRHRMVEQLTEMFPAEVDGIRKFFDAVVKVDEAVEPRELRHHGFVQALRFLRRHPIVLRYGRATFQRVLDHLFWDPRIKAMLSAPLFDLALGPREVSAVAALSLWGHFLEGAYYPRGGSRGLRDAFVRALRAGGVGLWTSTPVESLDKRGDDWLAVTRAGEEISARVAVSAIDPTIALGSIVAPHLVPWRTRHKVERMKPSLPVFFAFIGTDLDLPSLGIRRGNIAHFRDWSLADYWAGWRKPDPPPEVGGFFLTSSSVKDPAGEHAPAGKHSLELLGGASYELFQRWADLPPGERSEGYFELVRDIGGRLVAQAERYVPNLSHHLDFIELRSPLFLADRARAVRGGIYGPALTPDQTGYGRFPSLECGIDGLYLAGAGTISPGVAACCASGALAAELADEYLERTESPIVYPEPVISPP